MWHQVFQKFITETVELLINLWPSVHSFYPPFLSQCSVLRVFKAIAIQIRGKSKTDIDQMKRGSRTKLATSGSEGHTLTD